jgi:hypothetical protein
MESKDPPKTAWDYLNSPVGIWFLSSVILASITFFGTWLHSKFEAKRLDHEKRVALAYEISVRSSDFIEACNRAESYGEFWAAFAALQSPQYRLVQFKDAPMDELVYQLNLLPSRHDHDAGTKVKSTFNQIYKVLLTTYPDSDEQQSALRSKLKTLLNEGVVHPLHANAGDDSDD